MAHLFSLLLLATIPYDLGVEEHTVEQTEINHIYNGEAAWEATQFIWYERPYLTVRDWRYLETRHGGRPVSSFVIDHARDEIRTTFIHPVTNRVVVVKSRSFVESHTQYDREVLAREWLPVANRTRNLSSQ